VIVCLLVRHYTMILKSLQAHRFGNVLLKKQTGKYKILIFHQGDIIYKIQSDYVNFSTAQKLVGGNLRLLILVPIGPVVLEI
jgi:hypothetical protein